MDMGEHPEQKERTWQVWSAERWLAYQVRTAEDKTILALAFVIGEMLDTFLSLSRDWVFLSVKWRL